LNDRFPPIIGQEVKIDSIDLSEFLGELRLPGKIQQPRKRYVRTIPLSWAMKATSLKGKSAAVGMVLWYHMGVTKNRTVTLSNEKLKPWGIHRLAARRALEWLQEAGLVGVERSGNKSPRVTILEISEPPVFNASGPPTDTSGNNIAV